MGLIASTSMTLIAFSWNFPVEAHSVHIPLDQEELFLEIDLSHFILEEKKPIAMEQRRSRKSNQVIASDRPNITLSKMGKTSTAIRPLKVMNKVKSPERTLSTPDLDMPVSLSTLRPHEMPYLRSCGHIKDDIERFQCTQFEIRKHIAAEFKVPLRRDVPTIPDKVNVTFIIDEYGSIAEVLSDETIDQSLLKEVIRVFKAMPEMVPAASSGRRIAVRFKVPVAIKRI